MPRGRSRGRNNNNRATDRFISESSRRDEGGNFYGHDDRQSGYNRDSGRSQSRGISKRSDRNRGSRIIDSSRLRKIIEDVDMGAGGTNQPEEGSQRYNSPAYGGSGRRTKDRFQRSNQNAVSPRGTASLWSKITIPFGKNYEKDFILKTLLNASKSPFMPVYYHIQGNSSVFFVEDAAAADNLMALNKKITLHDGHKLTLIVKFSPAPNLPMNDELKEKIKLVMARRYNQATLALDLSQFHLDEELCTQYYTPLSRDNVLQTIVDIIGEHIPNVVAIDASKNKIFNLEQMKPLITKTPSLRSLNLGQNKLVQISKLDRLSGLPLEELILNQNPLCDAFSEQSTYIR